MLAIWSIMVLSVERLWVIYCITRNMTSHVRMNLIRMVSIIMWSAAIILGIPPLVGLNKFVYEVSVDKTV